MGKLSIDAEEIGCILLPWIVMTFQRFYFKGNIKKLKKQVKHIRILINEFISLSMKNNSQMTYHAFISDKFKEKRRGASKHSGAATGFRD
ncbi:Iron-sulfur binding reductase [Neochlamydia sp. S13]|nr:Iron-sulfur binding reductase [Neochlamydia sp. S13]